MMKKKLRKKMAVMKAFSLLESVISVFILSFGIVAVLPLLTDSLQQSHDSRDQIIAAFLAQEGIELVQNIRDNNWAAVAEGKAFQGQDNFPTGDKDNCRIQYDSTGLPNSSCNDGIDHKKLYLDGSEYYIHDNTGTATKFQRKISIDYKKANGDASTGRDDSDTAMAEITSTVSWGGSFPNLTASPPEECNTASKCAEVTVTLTTWH